VANRPPTQQISSTHIVLLYSLPGNVIFFEALGGGDKIYPPEPRPP
jgi:hypothetical protein